MVEDDEYLAKAYDFFLKAEGFTVTLVMNGTEVIKTALAVRPDIILLDLIIPGLNGFEVLARLKRNSKLKKIPVIIVSNLGQESDIRECRHLGAVDFLVKSDYSMKEVLSRVERELDLHAMPIEPVSKKRIRPY